MTKVIILLYFISNIFQDFDDYNIISCLLDQQLYRINVGDVVALAIIVWSATMTQVVNILEVGKLNSYDIVNASVE